MAKNQSLRTGTAMTAVTRGELRRQNRRLSDKQLMANAARLARQHQQQIEKQRRVELAERENRRNRI